MSGERAGDDLKWFPAAQLESRGGPRQRGYEVVLDGRVVGRWYAAFDDEPENQSKRQRYYCRNEGCWCSCEILTTGLLHISSPDRAILESLCKVDSCRLCLRLDLLPTEDPLPRGAWPLSEVPDPDKTPMSWVSQYGANCRLMVQYDDGSLKPAQLWDVERAIVYRSKEADEAASRAETASTVADSVRKLVNFERTALTVSEPGRLLMQGWYIASSPSRLVMMTMNLYVERVVSVDPVSIGDREWSLVSFRELGGLRGHMLVALNASYLKHEMETSHAETG